MGHYSNFFCSLNSDSHHKKVHGLIFSTFSFLVLLFTSEHLNYMSTNQGTLELTVIQWLSIHSQSILTKSFPPHDYLILYKVSVVHMQSIKFLHLHIIATLVKLKLYDVTSCMQIDSDIEVILIPNPFWVTN